MTNSEDLAGRRTVVLGASGGLGRALAAELAARGAAVVLVGRDPARLASVAVDGERHVADLRDPGAVTALFDAVAAAGPIDVVVNAVGVVAFGPLDELSDDVLEELFLVNAFVPLFVGRAALPRMAPDGTIVTISGVIAEQNLPGMVAYGASKAAARATSEGLAREARRRKVRVLDVRPPHTETGLADRAIEGPPPRFPAGLAPADVARRIVDGLVEGEAELPASAFS